MWCSSPCSPNIFRWGSPLPCSFSQKLSQQCFVGDVWKATMPRSRLTLEFCGNLAGPALILCTLEAQFDGLYSEVWGPSTVKAELSLSMSQLPTPRPFSHRITSSCRSEEQEAGMRNSFQSLLPKEKTYPAKLSSGQGEKKKNKKKALTWHAYSFLAYSFGYSFTAVYNLIIHLISLERCFIYIQVAFGWNHML